MALTASAVKNASARATPYKLADGGGMYLLITPTSSKLWRLKYRRPGSGVENALSLGVFPQTSLKQARDRRDEARRLLAAGIDPGMRRKAERVAAATTFEAIAREWLNTYRTKWSESHGAKITRRLELFVFPTIGNMAIQAITAPDILGMLKKIDDRGTRETAHRVRAICSQIFRYAESTGQPVRDPTSALRGAIPPSDDRHHAAITKPSEVGELLRAIDGFNGHPVTRVALQLAPLLFVRPGELRKAEWTEIDVAQTHWVIPATKMKSERAHIVPLSSQALALIEDLRLMTGSGRYLFSSLRTGDRPMSDNTLNAALRRLGYDKQTMTAHGFRAMARTILDEVLHERYEHIEHQLAHAVRDATGRAYNRTQHLPERTKMMQTWADYLDSLRHSPVQRTASEWLATR